MEVSKAKGMAQSFSKIKPQTFRDLVKTAGGKSYIPKATQVELKKLGLTSTYQSISQTQAERALGVLQEKGLIAKAKPAKQLLENVTSSAATGAPKKLPWALASRFPQKTSLKELKKFIKIAAKKPHFPYSQAVKNILKEAGITTYPYKPIKRQKLIEVVDRLQQAGLVSKIKKPWQLWSKFQAKTSATAAAPPEKLPYLGLKFLPSNLRPDLFLKYLEKVSGGNELAALVAANLMRELNLDRQGELGQKQMALILRNLQDQGLVATQETKEPLGKTLDKLERRRQAYVAMGISEERDEQTGRYTLGREELPPGVRRTVAQEPTTSIFRTVTPESEKTTSNAAPEEITSPTSITGAIRREADHKPTTSISRLGKPEQKKTEEEGELPDILAAA